MIYERIAADPALSEFIDCYWLIDSQGDKTIEIQKIIPDGFPELIFHYGDPYKININGSWENQPLYLLAGQIRNHFYLENTGASGMIGIKFKPAALSLLFDLDFSLFTDKVIPLESVLSEQCNQILQVAPCLENKANFISNFEGFLKRAAASFDSSKSNIAKATALISETHGLMAISKLCQQLNKSERQLERLFSRHIGLSPKFYSRIIRLAHIFDLMQAKDNSWSDLVYKSGFYDQSHFIKNFKEFTGEDPSSYGFDEKNMANFHLKKS